MADSGGSSDVKRRVAKLDRETEEKLATNRTVELQTSDLVDLAQSGQLDPRVIRTMALETHELVELRPAELSTDPRVAGDAKVIVEAEPSIVIAPELVPPPPEPAPQTPRWSAPPPDVPISLGPARTQPMRRVGGPNYLAIALYALAVIALAVALYKRFAS